MKNKITIPNEWLGEPIAGAMERILERKSSQNEPLVAAPAVQFSITNPRQYIQVPQHGIVIATAETHKEKDMYDTLEGLAAEGLHMPSPAQFMTHWLNVKEATEGRRNLLYADGTVATNDVAQDLWKYMSSGHLGGCWTRLNALFRNENNSWYVETDLKVTNAAGQKSLQGTKSLLENCIREDNYVALKFNAQGMPTEKSFEGKYAQGKNIYLYHPRNGAVARFYAYSGGAFLGCYRDAGGRLGALGVFASASVEARSARALGNP